MVSLPLPANLLASLLIILARGWRGVNWGQGYPLRPFSALCSTTRDRCRVDLRRRVPVGSASDAVPYPSWKTAENGTAVQAGRDTGSADLWPNSQPPNH